MQAHDNSDSRSTPNILNTAASVVSRELHQFISDIETLIKSAHGEDKSAFESASNNLRGRARMLKNRFEEMSESVQETACASAKTADAFAHNRPWYLAGIGACLGLVVGIALTKRD
ncbi:MAG TPA: hypothetical protein VIZ65_09570 [Cellvibrionaceae bacterium]